MKYDFSKLDNAVAECEKKVTLTTYKYKAALKKIEAKKAAKEGKGDK